jgi:glycosyltransferase involved in cell wall biosynthesis
MCTSENKMRIGIDIDARKNIDGMGTVARSLIDHLEKRGDIKIIHVSDDFNNNSFFVRFLIKAQKKVMRLFSGSYFDTYFEWQLLPKIIKEKKIHIYHTLGGTLPKKPSCITIQTCYDLSYHYDDRYLPIELVNYYEKFVRKSALTATHVIAISQSTKTDLINIWKIPAHKISVIYLGVDINKFSTRKFSVNLFKEKTGINFKYLLFVGNLNSRKNGIRLIKSFHIIADQFPYLKLIIIGSSGDQESGMKMIVSQFNLENKVLFFGRVDSDLLVGYYQNAEVFCYPSIHEGFGLPILEAMAAGTPVLTSNTSSMCEISGNAAVLVNPFDINSIADGIIEAMSNREKLISRGLQHVKAYTWDFSAEKLVKLYQLLLSAKSI